MLDNLDLGKFFGESEMPGTVPEVDGGSDRSKVITEETQGSIVIDRVTAATIKVPLVICGIHSKAVIDTGAEVTVMNEALYYRIPENRRPELRSATRNLVVAEAGKQMSTRGIIELDIQLGNESFTWSVYVAPIGDNILLGCDLIDEKDITINSKRGLQLRGQWIECETSRSIDGVARVRVDEPVTIPANSEVVITGKGENLGRFCGKYSVLEPIVEDERKLMVAHVLVDLTNNRVPVRLINLDDHPIKLKRNYLLGELHPVDQVTEFSSIDDPGKVRRYGIHSKRCKTCKYKYKEDELIENSIEIPDSWKEVSTAAIKKIGSSDTEDKLKNKADILGLPEYLVELYERSIGNLETEVQKQKLKELLIMKVISTFIESLKLNFPYLNLYILNFETKFYKTGSSVVKHYCY